MKGTIIAIVMVGVVAPMLIGIITLVTAQISRFTDRSHCIATMNDKVFFDGPAFRLNCKSQGMATQCTIKRGPFLIMADEHIVADNIKINCK